MKKKVILPIVEPVFSTYHNQGSVGAAMAENPSLKNWYLNESVMLFCSKRFLSGYTTPEVSVKSTALFTVGCMEHIWTSTKFLNGHSTAIIKNMIDNGYYVAFDGVDDYYLEGKTWYKKRHFAHDGMIYGYDDIQKTYNIFAYNQDWLYSGFEISQKSFLKAQKSGRKLSSKGSLTAFKPKALTEDIRIDPKHIAFLLKIYLDPNIGKQWLDTEKYIHGLEVYDNLCIYLNMVEEGSIPYEKIDWRIFRVIWEHKKVMYDRIRAVEEQINCNNGISKAYAEVVKTCDDIRLIYATYVMRRRDPLLQIIKSKLMKIKDLEKELVSKFIRLIETEEI